jgi:D-alanine-D-alanine ligase
MRARSIRPRVAILTDAVAEAEFAAQSAPGAPSNVEAVAAALFELGYDPALVEFDGDPAAWLEDLIYGNFRLVFNLCEGLSGHAAHEHLAAATVEFLGIPMTGAGSLALSLCLRKDKASAFLARNGVPVPDGVVVRAGESLERWPRLPVIVKPVAEDGSSGIFPESVARTRAQLRAALERGHATWSQMLVQRFIAGREFNVAVVGDHVLPHSEIDFSGLPEGTPPVVTYAAKWHRGSPEDRGTVPRCPAPVPDRLAARLAKLALRVWRLVDGTGYARVDVRVDGRGRAYVIDVNPNPDITPGSGLERQAAAAGWGYVDLVGRIVDDALAREDRLAQQRRLHLEDRRRQRRRRVADA